MRWNLDLLVLKQSLPSMMWYLSIILHFLWIFWWNKLVGFFREHETKLVNHKLFHNVTFDIKGTWIQCELKYVTALNNYCICHRVTQSFNAAKTERKTLWNSAAHPATIIIIIIVQIWQFHTSLLRPRVGQISPFCFTKIFSCSSGFLSFCRFLRTYSTVDPKPIPICVMGWGGSLLWSVHYCLCFSP